MQFDFSKLKASGALNSQNAFSSALLAAEEIITRHRENQSYARDAVTLLCEMTAERETAQAGAAALFPALIERLNDSFDPRACALYDRIMAQVIDFYRRLPDGGKLDAGLRSFGLLNESDLLMRKSGIVAANPALKIQRIIQRNIIRKAVLLSRVTIGADVAVTSVIVASLREALPDAEFVILGSHKLRDLYGGDQSLRIRVIDYDRSGGVLSRLNSWLDLVQAINDEISDLKPEEFLLIDPDSRLTQLGLLPVLRDERNYFFFESRSYQQPGVSRLGALASRWIGEILGAHRPAFPYVALATETRAFGKAISEKMRRNNSNQIAAVSLGVGGNPNKRISDSFEEELIQQLIERSMLILDKGASREEREQIDRIVEQLRSQGKKVVEVNEDNMAEALREETLRADVLTWNGGIGEFAGLIAASDQYIGYDSAGQHIAAALGVPVLTIFVNSNSPTFAERWQSYGSGEIHILEIDAGDLKPEANTESRVLMDIMAFLRKSRAK